MKYYFSIKHFLQTHDHWLHLKLDRTLTDWLTDSASIYERYSFSNACIFHNSVVWRVILLCDLYFQKLWLSLSYAIHTRNSYDFVFISRIFNSHRLIRCSPFWFINPLAYLLVQFYFCLMLSLETHLHSRFLLAIYLLIFKPSVLVFVGIMYLYFFF